VNYRQKYRMAALWLLGGAWLCLLVWLSSQDGAATAQTSLGLARVVATALGMPQAAVAGLDQTLRTAAHYVGFLVLGGLACAAACATWGRRPLPVLAAGGLCCLVAVLDEVKKVAITGRHLSWPEAGLNVLGVLTGVLIAAALAALPARRRRDG
jgi:VanZ family protein